jgi:hypothetical protein
VTIDDGEVDVSGTCIRTRKVEKLHKLYFRNLEFKTSLETEPEMGVNSKNESLENGFRRYRCDSLTSAYEFCAGGDKKLYTVSEKDCTLFLFFFLGAQCVESGVSCTDCY